MSLKENIDYIKEELNTEEKFLEKFIKFEQFYKKNKKVILGLAGIFVVGIFAYSINNFIQQQKLEKSNKAYLIVLKNPADSANLSILKNNNKKLYEVYQFQMALKNGNKDIDSGVDFLSDLSIYYKATNGKDINQLNDYSLSSKALLKDVAIFNEAYLLMKDNKIDEAKNRLSLISNESSIKELSNMLLHYSIKGNK